MQRRLSRNAALEGVKPSPLAQPQASSPGIPSPAASSGIAVQVLPMPGMSMAKTPSTPPASAKSKEPPPLKKNVCGPAPPPPPFAVGALSNSVQATTPVQAPTKVPVSPVSPVNQLSTQGDAALNTPSSPPFSSHSSDPRSPSPSLVSTESGGPNTIPAPPPMPPQCATARRASLLKSENQSTPASDPQNDANGRYQPSTNADNVSPAFSSATESSRSIGSSSLAVEDEATSYLDDSVTPSLASNLEKASADNQYSSNESLLKQISALEQITARHQSKSDTSGGNIQSSKGNAINNASTDADVPVQPILRLSTKSRSNQAEEKSKREADEQAKRQAEERTKMEEERRGREEQARLDAQEREKEQERIRREKEQERIKKEKEQEQIQKEKELERIKREEEERIRQEREKEQVRREKERKEEEQRRQQEAARVKEENERMQKIQLEKQKKLEEEQRMQQALERQRKEEAKQQEMELQRLEEERQSFREIEKQRNLEWQKQEEEWRKLRELEIQQQKELENHTFEDEIRTTGQNFRYQEPVISPPTTMSKNRQLRQGSVPVQLRSSALSNTSANQRHSSSDTQNAAPEVEGGENRSPNISPTTGLVRAPLPWMSAVPRRETSAPPEFVNYAQGTQTRLQQQHLQRGQRQQSQDYSKFPPAPSPVFKEAVVSSPPVVYQHPGGSNIKLGDPGRSTLPRHYKTSVEKTLSAGPALRPWAVKHQEYQQQKSSQGNNPAVDVNRARYQQPEAQQPQVYGYGAPVHTPPSGGGGTRWPEVQPPSFLRQSSTEAPAPKNPASTGAKVRIVPIVMEQDSSSETEHAYGSADSSTPTYVLNSGIRNSNPQSAGRFPGPMSQKSPPSQGQSPISPSMSKFTPGQPPFKVVRPSQQPVQKPQTSSGPVYYNNPIGMYSEGNAVEALQQMQQSLAQLNSGLQNPAPAPDAGAPVQSRSFRVLQQVVDNEASEPQAVDHASKAAQQQQARSFGNNSSAIPSRAFRALQQQTGGGDADAEVPRLGAPVRHNSLTSSSSFHPTSSSVFLNVSDKSTGNVGSTSQRHPESIHKNSAPQIIVNNGIKPKNVNSALTKQREASPSRWHVSTSNVTHDETPRGASPLVEEQSRLLKFLGEEAADSANKNGTPTMEPKKLYGGAKIPSRVFKHLQTEFSDASASAQPSTRNSRENLSPVGADKPQLSAGLLRLLQSDQNKLQSDKSDGDGSCVSSSYGEMDEYYSNGMANTAARKESVLRELTTQFDPFTECRKPKAAPGKVFRYLQQHYDTPDDGTAFRPLNNAHNGNISNSNKFSSEMEERKPKPSRFHSPSFNVLQNQYKNDEPSSNGLKLVTRRISLEKQDPINCNDPHDLTSLRITEEGDPVHSKPYVGKRIPGKTFRMLQENYTNHPSVLQARK